MTKEKLNILRRIDDFAKNYFDPWDYDEIDYTHDDNFLIEYADGLMKCPYEWQDLELDDDAMQELKNIISDMEGMKND